VSEEIVESVRSPVWELFAKTAAFIALYCFILFGLATYTYVFQNDAGWFVFGKWTAISKNFHGAIGGSIAILTSGFSVFIISLPRCFLGCYYPMA